jgi:hypothetical protein
MRCERDVPVVSRRRVTLRMAAGAAAQALRGDSQWSDLRFQRLSWSAGLWPACISKRAGRPHSQGKSITRAALSLPADSFNLDRRTFFTAKLIRSSRLALRIIELHCRPRSA